MKNVYSVIGLVGFTILAFGSSGSDESSSSEKKSSQKEAASENGSTAKSAPAKKELGSLENPYPKGQSGVVNEIETTIASATFKKKVKKGYFDYAAGEGATLVIVDYKVKNVSKEPISCLTYADSVIDPSGIAYDYTSDCSMAIDDWTMEKINPNLVKTFQACFEVPEGVSGLKLKFDCGWDDGFFDLGI